MNFKTFIEEAKKSDKEPVITDFKRQVDTVHDRYEDVITVDYKGSTYQIVQAFSVLSPANPARTKHQSSLLLNTGLKRKDDEGNFNYVHLNKKKIQRTLEGGDFYLGIVNRTLDISNEEYEVLKIGVKGQHERKHYIKKFALGMKPKTAKHFGDIIGKLRE